MGAALAGLLVAAPRPAAAAEISCGAVVTEDIKLSGDLLDCPDTGIVIGADGITLDLGGHTVSGVGGQTIGIENREGHDDVRIINGTVRHFGVGIFLAAGRFGELPGGADRNELSDLTVSDNDFDGIDVFYSKHVLVTHSTIYNNAYGLELVGGERNRIVRYSDFAGIDVADGYRNELRENAVNDNVDRPGGQEGPGDGIVIERSSATRLIRNQANRNGDDGIDVDAPATTLVANEANLNGDLGIEAVPGVDGGGNRASGNGNPLQCLNVSCISTGMPAGQLDATQAVRTLPGGTAAPRLSRVELQAVRD